MLLDLGFDYLKGLFTVVELAERQVHSGESNCRCELCKQCYA